MALEILLALLIARGLRKLRALLRNRLNASDWPADLGGSSIPAGLIRSEAPGCDAPR
jgi:hypothetical protein